MQNNKLCWWPSNTKNCSKLKQITRNHITLAQLWNVDFVVDNFFSTHSQKPLLLTAVFSLIGLSNKAKSVALEETFRLLEKQKKIKDSIHHEEFLQQLNLSWYSQTSLKTCKIHPKFKTLFTYASTLLRRAVNFSITSTIQRLSKRKHPHLLKISSKVFPVISSPFHFSPILLLSHIEHSHFHSPTTTKKATVLPNSRTTKQIILRKFNSVSPGKKSFKNTRATDHFSHTQKSYKKLICLKQ